MSSDDFSSGVDILYPHDTMNPHPFSEPEWSSHSPFVPSPYEPRSPFSAFTVSQEPLPPQPVPQPYPDPRRPPPIQMNSVASQPQSVSRTKSSPSAFGSNVEEFLFTETPFRAKHDDFPPPIFTLSPQAATSQHNKISSSYYPSSEYGVAGASTSPHRTRPVPIAPDPVGLSNMNALRRAREDEETSDYGSRKRKRAASQSGSVELNEEEQLLFRLKEEENLPWKDIAVRFQTDLGKTYQVPALQMRFKRLRERMRAWTDTDIEALEQAYEYWEKFQFDIIATKMLDFGASERWPPKYCAQKWDELHPGRGPYSAQSSTFLRDPWDPAVSPIGSSVGHLSPRTATM